MRPSTHSPTLGHRASKSIGGQTMGGSRRLSTHGPTLGHRARWPSHRAIGGQAPTALVDKASGAGNPVEASGKPYEATPWDAIGG